MQNINTLLSAYNLNEPEIQQILTEAKAASIGCGTRVSRELSSNTWTLLDDISDGVWYSKMEITHKISLGFQLYEIFPSYSHFLVPFYRGIRDGEIIDQSHKIVIWKQFMHYLASEAYYADPVGYVLWVDFFEDTATVRETWQGLVNNYADKKALLALLESAGPVPFDLKEEQYKLLISEERNHKYIFNSLLFSAFDVYGKIDRTKASIILNILKVDTESEDFKLLKEKLKYAG